MVSLHCFHRKVIQKFMNSAGILEKSMGASNRVGIPARRTQACGTILGIDSLESIPGLLKGLKIPPLFILVLTRRRWLTAASRPKSLLSHFTHKNLQTNKNYSVHLYTGTGAPAVDIWGALRKCRVRIPVRPSFKVRIPVGPSFQVRIPVSPSFQVRIPVSPSFKVRIRACCGPLVHISCWLLCASSCMLFR